MTRDYPRWCCWECGVKHGTKKPRIASWHFGKCDVCRLNNNVTEPRDFGHFANWFTAKGKKSYELQSSGGKSIHISDKTKKSCDGNYPLFVTEGRKKITGSHGKEKANNLYEH